MLRPTTALTLCAAALLLPFAGCAESSDTTDGDVPLGSATETSSVSAMPVTSAPPTATVTSTPSTPAAPTESAPVTATPTAPSSPATGSPTGSTAMGGAANGGTSGNATDGGAGAISTGGANTGGSPTGGTGGAMGGSAGEQGSPGGGGSGGLPFGGVFMLGADISEVQQAVDDGAIYVDTDGQTKNIFELLKAHGFNTMRLRTFVDPGAEYGYACNDANPYCDTAHTVEFGRQVKEAGMMLLLDFHYSDTWADPGKQVIPEAWRDVTSVEQLAMLVRDYTEDAVTQMVAGGARPDMVQVGNEITPGMLIHTPTPNTDCYGANSEVNPAGITGQASDDNWDNLALLLTAGVDGVKAVDPSIKIMLHIENTDDPEGVAWWVDSAKSRGVEFDVLGLSCYVEYQGEPSVWRSTFTTIAAANPDLGFVIAEYNPERSEANRIMRELPNGQGLGTFFWEPTRSGSWGQAMFTRNGNTYTANNDDFAEFDALRAELGL